MVALFLFSDSNYAACQLNDNRNCDAFSEDLDLWKSAINYPEKISPEEEFLPHLIRPRYRRLMRN